MQSVRYERSGAVGHRILCNPPSNLLNVEFYEQLREALLSATSDDLRAIETAASKIKVEGAHGQAADQRVEKYERTELPNLAQLKSGDLVEVELEIDSKNDYEYLIFEDPKAAGFEPLLVRSGYNPNDMGAFMELRDEKVCFFVRQLARGKHSVSYRMRAEIPGRFSALRLGHRRDRSPSARPRLGPRGVGRRGSRTRR